MFLIRPSEGLGYEAVHASLLVAVSGKYPDTPIALLDLAHLYLTDNDGNNDAHTSLLGGLNNSAHDFCDKILGISGGYLFPVVYTWEPPQNPLSYSYKLQVTCPGK